MPGGGDVADDDDLVRGERRGDHAQPLAEKDRHLFERADGDAVGGERQLDERLEALQIPVAAHLVVVAQAGAVGGQGLPAAEAAAGAGRAVGLHLDVAELAGHAVLAAQQAAVGEDAGADAFGDVDGDDIVRAVAVAEPDLGERAGVGGVVHLDPQAGGALDARVEAEHRPAQVGSEDELLQMQVRAAGQADADALEGAVGVVGDQLATAAIWPGWLWWSRPEAPPCIARRRVRPGR